VQRVEKRSQSGMRVLAALQTSSGRTHGGDSARQRLQPRWLRQRPSLPAYGCVALAKFLAKRFPVATIPVRCRRQRGGSSRFYAPDLQTSHSASMLESSGLK